MLTITNFYFKVLHIICINYQHYIGDLSKTLIELHIALLEFLRLIRAMHAFTIKEFYSHCNMMSLLYIIRIIFILTRKKFYLHSNIVGLAFSMRCSFFFYIKNNFIRSANKV